MTDRELLELAAKAAGYGGFPEHFYYSSNGDWFLNGNAWNPIIDDGDALRLAVRLGLTIDVLHYRTMAITDDSSVVEKHNDDPYAATRRAIVRAAAEIGKDMK